MLKTLTLATLGSVLVCCTAATASAKTKPPPSPPNARHELPSAAARYPADRLPEGRSIHRMQAPSTFYYGTDERGYPTGDPQNPRTGS